MKGRQGILLTSLLMIALTTRSHIIMSPRSHHSRPESKKTSIVLDPNAPEQAQIHAGRNEDVVAQDQGLFNDQEIPVIYDEDQSGMVDQGEGTMSHIPDGEKLESNLDPEEFEEKQAMLEMIMNEMEELYMEHKNETMLEMKTNNLHLMIQYMKELHKTREHERSISELEKEEENEDLSETDSQRAEEEHEGEADSEESEGDESQDWEEVNKEDKSEHDPFDDETETLNIDEPDAEAKQAQSDWDSDSEQSTGEEEEQDLSEKAMEVAQEEEAEELGVKSDDEEEEEWDKAVEMESQEHEVTHEEDQSQTTSSKYISDEEKEAEKHAEAKEHAANFSRDGGPVVANFNQLANMMIVAEGIIKVYNELFLDFPKEAEDKQSTAQLEQVYIRVKEFVQSIVAKKEELFKEIDYEKAHLESIGYSREEVLDYYDFKMLWQNLENEANPRDEDWIQKKKILDLESSEFVENVKSALKSVTNVESFQDLIWNETVFIRDQMSSGKAISVQDKITGLPSLVEKLLDIKFDIDKNLNELSLSLKNIHGQKREFKEQLVGMQMYLGHNDYNEGVLTFSIWTLILFLVVFFDRYV